MKKKNLDDQMNFENFNKTLFDQSIKMINSHKKIPLGDVQLYLKDDMIK